MGTESEGVQERQTASNKSSASTAWILFAVSTIAMLIFAGLYFSNPKTKTEVPLFTNTVTNEFVKDDKVLFGMKNIGVVCKLNGPIKEFVSEDEIRSKFELTLRRNNVVVNSDSPNTVYFSLQGRFDDSRVTVTYVVTTRVEDVAYLNRPDDRLTGEWHRALVEVWGRSVYGQAVKAKARDEFFQLAETHAEQLANDFLSANSTSK